MYKNLILHHIKGPQSKSSVPGREQLLQAAVTLVAVPPGIAFIDHKISSSLVAACLLPWLRSLPLSLYEHLEGWAVNQALRAVLLNNYLLPKEHAFNLDFFHLVISVILQTAASAQWKQQASFQEQNQNCRVETPSIGFAGILLNYPWQMSRGRLARLLPGACL